jgi:hypothetical protein
MSFANGTRVSINATAQKAIESITDGQTVYAAAYNNAAQWSQQTVQLSNGTHGGRQSTMIYIVYLLQGNERNIIVTGDQPFLLATKQLKQASRLIPGDNLLSPTGASLEVLKIAEGAYLGDVHDISIDTIGGPGHWIVAAGIVCGDFDMEINQQADNSPAIGTPEYQTPHQPLATEAQPPKRAPRPRKK